MKIRLKRIAKRDSYTIGKLSINGKNFCDTLEDVDRGLEDSMPLEEIKAKKVKGETAIPIGTYQVIITYSPRFKRQLPLLLSVKGFEGVRIHSGNSHKDTEGCILVGLNKEVGKVLDSRYTFNRLFERINTAFKKGETITIEIS